MQNASPNPHRLAHYAQAFRKLRKDRNPKRWPALVKRGAPHKPLLLLAVLDLFAEGRMSTNLITPDPELCALFDSYWLRVMPHDWHGDISLPFYHLGRDGFWHLKARSGSEHILKAGRRLTSLRQLHDHTLGTALDHELFDLLQEEAAREPLRAALIEAHFAPEAHTALLEQGKVNSEAFKYSQQLLEKAHQRYDAQRAQDEVAEPVRDQGFRRAVVTVYENRCALCGLRVQTADSHTAVDAAHIIPWSISHNDDIRNGMALCKLCHWVFDKGLMGVSAKYTVLLSDELTVDYNLPGHLLTLKGREMTGPQEGLLWPDKIALAWHRKERLR